MGVQRLGDKRYRIFIDRGRDPSGRRQRYSEIFRGSKKQADDRERALRTDLVNGTFVESKAGTVGDFLEQWLRSVQSRVEERTYLRYAQLVRTHLAPDLGHIKLKDLGPYQIEEAEQKWAREGNRNTGGPLSPQTVLHMHRCLHTALDRAVKWRLLAVNPVDGVDAPHVAQEEMGYLTPAEAARLVDALEGTEYELPILVGLFCGLRPTEYLALRWRDLDLERGELRVMQNVHDIRKDRVTEHMGQQVRGFRFGPTKTHRSRRPVSMPDELVQRLRLWRSVQSAHRLQVGEVWVDLDLVFTNTIGLPHSEETIRDRFYRVLEAAGLQRVRLYDLRHTMATLILNDTKDIKLVASRLGHANEYLVLRRYGHLLPGFDQAASARLSELIRQARPAADGTRMAHGDEAGSES